MQMLGLTSFKPISPENYPCAIKPARASKGSPSPPQDRSPTVPDAPMSEQNLLNKACQRDVAINDSDLVSMRYSRYATTRKPLPVATTWQRSSKKQSPIYTVQAPAGANQPKRLQEAEANDPAETKAVDFEDEWSKQFLFLVHS
jgi:hypothetical protein